MTKRMAACLDAAKKFVMAAVGVAALVMPAFIGMMYSPFATAQAQTLAVATTEIESQGRLAYAKANFENPAMIRAYVEYGPPDQKSRAGEVEIWRYNYLPAFHSYVELEFQMKGGQRGMRINWPPPLGTFAGDAPADSLLIAALAESLGKEAQAAHPSWITARAGLPGGHAMIQVYSAKPNVLLSIPLNLLSGKVDVIGNIVTGTETAEKSSVAANLRDITNSTAGTYQSRIMLPPGSYNCLVLVREQATGLMYPESIPFEVK